MIASWAPFRAGAEVAAERLAVGLRKAGHRVTVVLGTQGETLERMQEAGVDVRYVPLAFTDKMKWIRYRASQRELRRILCEIAPDVVYANDLPTSQMVGQAVRRLAIPFVCHHRWVFEGAAIEWLNKFGAERHVFVSNALMSQLCECSPRLAASQRAVVYDGLPLPALPTEADRLAARTELSLPKEKKIVLYAGQIIERKGVADLLRAWRLLSERWREAAELVLVGDDQENDGCYRREMERLASELGCAARFPGYQRDVAAWLTAADLCVVPSHVEPLGNATLEAMAHGRAIVGTDTGGIPEMIEDGESGLLVPPRNPPKLAAAIEELLNDPHRAASFGANARVQCEQRFSIDAHVQAMVQEFERSRSLFAVADTK